MWEREQLSLKRHLSDISFNIQELRVILDELYMNEQPSDTPICCHPQILHSYITHLKQLLILVCYNLYQISIFSNLLALAPTSSLQICDLKSFVVF